MTVAMSNQMFAKAEQAITRVLHEETFAIAYHIANNRNGATSLPTHTLSRNVRVTLPGEARAFTVAVSVTEIAAGSVAGASVAATDDI